MGEGGFTPGSPVPRCACFIYKLLPLTENEQKAAEAPSSAQRRESTAEFECHPPLAYLLLLPSVNQQLTAYSSKNTFYLLIHCLLPDSFPGEPGRLTLPHPWPRWPEATISHKRWAKAKICLTKTAWTPLSSF